MLSIRRLSIILLVGLIAVFLQGTIIRSFSPAHLLTPNLLLLVVIVLGFHENHVMGAVASFLVGLELDLSSAMLLGPSAGAAVVVFGFLACFSQHLFIESTMAAMVVTFLCSLLYSLVYAALVFQFKTMHAGVIWLTLEEAIITALIAPWILRFLKRVLVKRESGHGLRTSALRAL